MEADNQNKWKELRNGLDALSELPGENPFDTNSAWDKLSARLERKPIHRKPAFYWAAAAILLCILSAALFMTPQRTHTDITKTPNTPKIIFDSSHDVKPAIINHDVATLKKEPPQHLTSRLDKIKPPVKKMKVPTSINNNSSVIKIAEPILQPEGLSLSTALVRPDTVALVQSKTIKLIVIHNNELNSVMYKPELSVTNTPARSGQFRFSRNASDNILQVKISLTN